MITFLFDAFTENTRRCEQLWPRFHSGRTQLDSDRWPSDPFHQPGGVCELLFHFAWAAGELRHFSLIQIVLLLLDSFPGTQTVCGCLFPTDTGDRAKARARNGSKLHLMTSKAFLWLSLLNDTVTVARWCVRPDDWEAFYNKCPQCHNFTVHFVFIRWIYLLYFEWICTFWSIKPHLCFISFVRAVQGMTGGKKLKTSQKTQAANRNQDWLSEQMK